MLSASSREHADCQLGMNYRLALLMATAEYLGGHATQCRRGLGFERPLNADAFHLSARG